jgi:hypothetical protein
MEETGVNSGEGTEERQKRWEGRGDEKGGSWNGKGVERSG